MRDHYDEFTARGAGVAAIGMGWQAAAADFRDRHDIPFPLLIDQRKQTYKALDIKRGTVNDLIGPKVWLRGIGAVARHGWHKHQQDALQLGATMVVQPDGKVIYVHRSVDSSDNAPVQEILGALA